MRPLTGGSPPRMRGKLETVHPFQRVAGITPAHAGKTRLRRGGLCDTGDHPRACGENKPLRPHRLSNRGSPPRMRGKRRPSLPASNLTGITPAHAGKTIHSFMCFPFSWDHPRACGENMRSAHAFLMKPGSPPRMRGKRRAADRQARSRGITPAHAGKTIGYGSST